MTTNRLTDNWLDSYLIYRDNSEPPILFNKWSGVSTIAACLQRKCYTDWETRIYPNLYIVIIGPSGLCRKGTAMGPCLAFLRRLGIQLSAEKITTEALIQSLAEATESITDLNTGIIKFHSSLTIFSKELSVFLGDTNSRMIDCLTDWFDCDDPWKYQTKNCGTNEIDAVWVNLIGATTPGMMRKLIPVEAIEGGLASRIIFVFGDRPSKIVPYGTPSMEELELGTKLQRDLELIHMLSGEFIPTDEYRERYIDFYIQHHKEKIFDDVNLQPYLTRRPTHLRKLSMIMSASRGDDQRLTIDDFSRAYTLLTETEALMPNVFMGYGRSELAALMPQVMGVIASKQDGMTLKELYAVFYRDTSQVELRDILTALCGIGKINMIRDADGTVMLKFIRGGNE